MASHRQLDMLGILRQELSFLKSGGYRHPDKAKWRAHFIFEDSPTCLNYGDAEKSWPCDYCPLFAYVPEKSQGTTIPCRHIPLNSKGETLDSLYRAASPEEIEAIVEAWLEKEIERLEKGQREEACAAGSA
jgi:hypothetical protein